MPPSGYDISQADSVVAFLESCSKALRKESRERTESLQASLAREIRGIVTYLDTESPAVTQRSILELTGYFYRLTLEKMERGATYSDSVADVLREVAADIKRIHVREPV